MIKMTITVYDIAFFSSSPHSEARRKYQKLHYYFRFLIPKSNDSNCNKNTLQIAYHQNMNIIIKKAYCTVFELICCRARHNLSILSINQSIKFKINLLFLYFLAFFFNLSIFYEKNHQTS